MSKQETQTKETLEKNRQMELIDEAEANPQPDQAQLRAIRENQKRRQQQIEEKNQIAAAKKAEEEEQAAKLLKQSYEARERSLRGILTD